MKTSAGILMYRDSGSGIEVLLVHPGGPFWAKKDDGAWSIPKGEFSDGDDPLAAALREFEEELGAPPSGTPVALKPARQSGGKTVYAWMMKGDFDVCELKSNTFTMEWPPRTGRMQEFPEVDRAAWFPTKVAEQKILKGQIPFLRQLVDTLANP